MIIFRWSSYFKKGVKRLEISEVSLKNYTISDLPAITFFDTPNVNKEK